MSSRRLLFGTPGLALIVAACGTSNSGGVESIDVAVYTPQDSSISQVVASWADDVEAKTDGEVSFNLHYNASLLAANDTLEGVADGRADAGMVGAVYYENQLPLTSIVSIPYVSDQPLAAMNVLSSMYESNEAFTAEYDESGVVPVFFIPASRPLLGSTGAPIESIDDLAGTSVRAVGVLTDALQAANANPVAISFPELYESLERGVVDAYSGVLLDSVVVSGFHEVAPYISDPGMGLFSTYPVVVDKGEWDALPPETKQIMRESGERALGELPDYERVAFADACAQIEEAGGVVVPWSQDEIDRWDQAIGDSITAKWRERAGDNAAEFETDYRNLLSNDDTAPPAEDLAMCAD